MISIGGDELNEQKMSRMLYGGPVTQKNLIGVKSLKQAVDIESKLPSIIQDKLVASRPLVMKNLGESGPIRAVQPKDLKFGGYSLTRSKIMKDEQLETQ